MFTELSSSKEIDKAVLEEALLSLLEFFDALRSTGTINVASRSVLAQIGFCWAQRHDVYAVKPAFCVCSYSSIRSRIRFAIALPPISSVIARRKKSSVAPAGPILLAASVTTVIADALSVTS